ncbi:M15 family metallopeptidase [Allosphingosinicella deserti]|uniref:M15 family metallopeptidase n=1 Tax=Allosphingosinicella deserti TaxID=2116704 RepID=UPI0018ECC853|nr:M15 family metallopeptidase [Sphingomonas deserti]
MNERSDTIAVQTLLTRAGMRLGLVDGRCGPRTISAIIHYQNGFLRHPDGLVEPNATTWRHLTGQVGGQGLPGSTPIRYVTPVRTPVRTGWSPATSAGPESPPPTHSAASPLPASAPAPIPANNSISYTTLLPKPARNTINKGLHSPSNRVLLEKFGSPRETYSQNDQPITNERLKRMLVTESVGPFRATGLRPAVQSLRQVMSDVQAAVPTLYNAISSAGMTVCRLQRGSSTAISNHSWGTAIDLKIGGRLDPRGDSKVQHGLLLLAPFFNARGWYWGAGFGVEDGMHFECSTSLIASFAS